MVLSWLLNSICKEIVESLVYARLARDPWLEIEARYGESNGPLIFQIQKEIRNAMLGNRSITTYYTILKRLWDELNVAHPIPPCSCDAGRLFNDFLESQKVGFK